MEKIRIAIVKTDVLWVCRCVSGNEYETAGKDVIVKLSDGTIEVGVLLADAFSVSDEYELGNIMKAVHQDSLATLIGKVRYDIYRPGEYGTDSLKSDYEMRMKCDGTTDDGKF